MYILPYHPTPLQRIHHPLLEKDNVAVTVKREDLNHPYVSGNKWWKLKYNLMQALETGATVITFGGAFSNHIYATAAACQQLKIPSIGVIRGEMVLPLNPTLDFAKSQGMELHFVSRGLYRNEKAGVAISLEQAYGKCLVIPEGGSNAAAVKGVAEFASELPDNFDYVILPVGTGGTMAGLICGYRGESRLLGVSVLKDGDFLREDIEKLATQFASSRTNNWHILTKYHHGGYAKVSHELLQFIDEIAHQCSLPLDHVYSGKALYALFQEIKFGNISPGSSVLFIHTGGLQGSLRTNSEKHENSSN